MEARRTPFTGHIMRGNAEVAEVTADEVVSCNSQAPLMIQRTMDYSLWLKSRSADIERNNMRAIRKALGLSPRSQIEPVEFVCAASVTDNFWTRKKDSSVGYDSVKFQNDHFFKAALSGDANLFSLEKEVTPELTNIGSFNKGWRLSEGEWILYKQGNDLEYFSELFTSCLAQEAGLSAVPYFMKDGFIACKNFVPEGQCLELAEALLGEDDSYESNIPIMKERGLLKPYLDLIFLDAIVRNADRHTQNYGFLTSPNAPLALAPNFDNNMSLFFQGVPQSFARNDVLVQAFCAVYPALSEDYKLPDLTENMINNAYGQAISQIELNVTLADVTLFCMNAYNQIKRR